MKIYPAMDLLGGRVVRLREGKYDQVTVFDVDPAERVAAYARDGAERVHIVDLDGARDGRPTQQGLLRAILAAANVRVQIGGGIRTMTQLEGYADAGAERFVLGTAAARDDAFLRAACARFSIVVAVDAVDGVVAVDGWTRSSGIRAVDLARHAQEVGAAAVLYTDIHRDGTGGGPNVQATADLARAVPGLEVIASGGVATVAHVEALRATRVIAACVVGRALYDGTLSLRALLDGADA